MRSFGHLPRTRIVEGTPGSWSGRNGVFTGIELYRSPIAAGVWAQEFWEWRLHALWALLSALAVIAGTVLVYVLQSWIPLWIGILAGGFAMVVGMANRAAREIYSHAITLEASLMVGEPATLEDMVGSLVTYPYCKGISSAALLDRLRSARPRARSWCERHRHKIGRVAAIAAGGS
jgi:hypothetical protein